MNNLFRSSKSSSKSRQSGEQPSGGGQYSSSNGELGASSIPYERISSTTASTNGRESRTLGLGSLTAGSRGSTASTSSSIGPAAGGSGGGAAGKKISLPTQHPDYKLDDRTSGGQDVTIHDYFARTAGDRADVVGKLSRRKSPEMDDEFGGVGSGSGSGSLGVTSRGGPNGSMGRNPSSSSSRASGSTSRVMMLRDGPSPVPSIANPNYKSQRRRDSDQSMRSINAELSRYPSAADKPPGGGSVSSRASGQTLMPRDMAGVGAGGGSSSSAASSMLNGVGGHSSSSSSTMYGNSPAGPSSSSVNLPETILEDDFNLARPDDPAEIEAMFQHVVAGLDFAANHDRRSTNASSSSTLGGHHRRDSSSTVTSGSPGTGLSTYQNVQSMSLDKKWTIVESDHRSRWLSAKRQANYPPQFYVNKMVNSNLTNSELKNLEIMLRTSKVQ
jgi:hypothetical protein